MVNKKHPAHDLEKKRGTFLAIGMALSLFFVLTAMEWRTAIDTVKELAYGERWVQEEEEEIVITERKEKKKFIPPDQPRQVVPDEEPEVDPEPEPEPEPAPTIPDSVLYGEPEPEVFEPEPEFFIIVEEMPSFGKDKNDLKIYLNKKLDYVNPARSMGISGTVYIQFIVDEKGKVIEPIVQKGPGYGLNKEALRVVKGMPKWNPGKQRGKPVPVKFTIPVKFILRG